MKLTDIKKLKVTELRSRLKELGLDSKGLKPELVVRLWSASEAAQSGTVCEEEVQVQNDSSTMPLTPAETAEVHSLSPSPPTTEACVTTLTEVDHREYADTATQTETDPSPQALQSGYECVSEGMVDCQAEGGQLENQQRHAEDGGEDKTSEDIRGRAFYEFKEEIRYKR